MSLSAQDKNRIFGRIGLTIGLIGFFLGGIVVPVGAMHHEGWLSTPVAVLILLVITGGAVWGFFKIYFHPGMTGRPENEALLQNGVPAAALVLQKSDTGLTVNTQPQVELLLEVTIPLPDCPAYQTKITTTIPRLQPDLYDPGTVLEVRVDRKDPKRVAIVRIVSIEEEAQGSDPLVSRPEKISKKSNSRKGRKSTNEEQK